MTREGRLLLVNHTEPLIAREYEEQAREGGMWRTTIIEPLSIGVAEGEFDAIMLLGLSDQPEKGYALIRQLKARWPAALLYVVTQHGKKEVRDTCVSCGATRIFQSDRVGSVMSYIKKPPD